MDTLRASLTATSLVFFWGVVFLCLMAAGAAGYFSFALVMVPPGVLSLAGSIGAIRHLKVHSPAWFLAIPLAVVIAGGTLTSVAFLLIAPWHPGDPVTIGAGTLGAGFLMALAPCAILLIIACSPLLEERRTYWLSLALIAIIALLPLVMLGDLVSVALRITASASIVHPWWEGLMLLYGIAGSPFIGILLIMIARHVSREKIP
jgi:hypothetical protein